MHKVLNFVYFMNL